MFQIPIVRYLTCKLLCPILIACGTLPLYADAANSFPIDLTQEERIWLDQNSDKLILYFNTEFPPIEFQSSEGKYVGLGADVITLVEQQLGVTFSKIPCEDWNRHLAALESGECAIAPTIVSTVERRRYTLFTTPYATVPVVIITPQSRKGKITLSDLTGQRVAVVSGFATENYIRTKAQGRFEIVTEKNVTEGLRAVSFGQVDAFVENLAVAAYYIEKEGIPNLRVAGSTDYAFTFSIGVSRKYPLLYSAIQKALDAIPPSELETVTDRWISLKTDTGLSPETRRLLKIINLFVGLLLLSLVGISYFLKRRLNEKVATLKISQQKLVDQTKRLALATEVAHAGIWDFFPQTEKVFVSEQWYGMLGYSPGPQEILRSDWRDLIHPEDQPLVYRSVQAYIDSGGKDNLEFEARMRHADGSWRWILTKGRTVSWDTAGKPTRIIGLNLDIHNTKEVQAKLAFSEARLRTIFDHSPYTIVINRLEDGMFLDANRAFLEDRNITLEELLQAAPEKISKLDAKIRKALVDKLVQTGLVKNQEIDLEIPNGNHHTMIYSAALMEIEGEKQILSMMVDVTERKLAEEALKKSEETFRALTENLEDVIMRFDRDLRHTYVNSVIKRTLGLSPAEIIGKTHEELGFPPDLCRLFEEAIQHVFRTGKRHRIEFQLPNGIWQDWLLMPEFNERSTVEAVITSSRDITDRKHAEEEREKLQSQLTQSQKMEAVGTLAGGVAHDFNNMLGAIIGYAEMGLEEAGQSDVMQEYLNEILRAAQRSANLTRQLLAFARKQTVAPVTLDLNNAVEDMLKMLRRLIGENIRLVWKPGERQTWIRIDPSQLDQLLANLCVNARDAIGDVGQITIETSLTTFDKASMKPHPESPPGSYVLLAVSDDGCGMTRETREHAFEPFFTTKGPGEGTGLGLSTVYGIVKQNNGFIEIDSERGSGTAFRIYLPYCAGIANQSDESSLNSIPAGQGETILLVEDDPTLLTMTQTMLQRMHYNVIPFNKPGEALRQVKEDKLEFQLFITDLVMPQMNGKDLAEKILAHRPNIPHLFMSGYSTGTISHRGILDEGVNFLQKPFNTRELAIKIRQVMDRK